MPFANASQQVVQAFAANLGLPSEPARDGSYSFLFERSGALTLTPSADGMRVLMSLARMRSQAGDAIERRALDQAGLDLTTNRVIHAGLAKDESVVLALSVDDSEISVPLLDECFQQLVAIHDAIAWR